MGFLDTAGNLIDQGVAGAKKGTKTISLKTQIGEVAKRREANCAQFGATVYEQMRNNPEFRASHEAFFASIESLDAQIDALKSELAFLENPPQGAPMPADQSYPAPGFADQSQPVPAQPDIAPQVAVPIISDAAPAPAAVAAGKPCTSCGFLNPQESMFCGECGAKL